MSAAAEWRRPRPIHPLNLLAHAAALAPLAWLAADTALGRLSVNPVQDWQQRTGLYALNLLVASLAVTPAHILTGWNPVLRLRRVLGLYAFGYAALHLVVFAALDYGLDLALILEDTGTKPYILVGLAALFILSALAATSFDYAKIRLRKNWKRLHRLAYLAAGLAVLHFAWAVKGSLSSLQGDLGRPLLYGAIIAALLLVRLPPIRRVLVRLRHGQPAGHEFNRG